MDNKFPEWHYFEEGDSPPDNLFVPLIIQDEEGYYYLRYWDGKWWDHPNIGWLPHYAGAEGTDEIIIKRWTFLPTSFYETNNKCDCFFIRDGEGHCFGTKELDVCSCKGITKFCDFYDYMRRR